MGEIFKVLNLVRNFDLRDNPNGGQDIKLLVETIGSAHKIKLESVGGMDNKEEIKRLIN